MEIFLLFGFLVGWALGGLMVAALVGDFRDCERRPRAWAVLIGTIILAATPTLIEAAGHKDFPAGEALLLFSVTFGLAALLMYAVIVVSSAAIQLYRRWTDRNDIAA
jgi:hypothetical protein